MHCSLLSGYRARSELRLVSALGGVRQGIPWGGTRQQIFKDWGHRFDTERRTDVNLKGQIMELSVKQKATCWATFSFNTNTVRTYAVWTNTLLFLYRRCYFKHTLIGKDPDAGRDWGQEEKETTEDEMAGWHHWLNGHEFEWTPGVGDRQGGLACCDSWGHKDSDTTERLNWAELVNVT